MQDIINKGIEGGYVVDTSSYDSIRCSFMNSQFWQALGKAKEWEDGDWCMGSSGYEYKDKDDWLKHALKFYEINLTQGFDEAVKWLEDLIK